MLFNTSCDNGARKGKLPDEWDLNNVRSISVDDSAYLYAVKKAQESLDNFIELLNNKTSNKLRFHIKSQFSDGEHTEHMWLVADTIQNGIFTATLDNVPKYLRNIGYQDTVEVSRTDVEDWIVYDGDSMVLGNFMATPFLE